MAGACAYCSPRWNFLPADEDELASAALTKSNDTPTPTPIVSCAPTPALAANFARLFISAAVNLAARYSAKNLQEILKTIPETRALALQPEGVCERPLKSQAPDLYRGNNHIECYNFCRKCEDHFATGGATWLNRVPFAITFLKDQALLRWQQHQCKLADKTDDPITWEKYKVFFCRSVGKSKAFVDSIWSTIWKDSQYQLEEVLDSAAHLEHLKTVPKEFNPTSALKKADLIYHFCDGPKSSIQA